MEKILTKNRKAKHDFEVLQVFEAGIALKGHEVKSLRNGGGNFAGSFVSIIEGQAKLKNFNIRLYEKTTLESYDPTRERTLLLRKQEIEKIASALNTKGVTVIPLSCGLKKGKVKVEIALARGKNKVDKRHDLKKRDQERRIQKAIKNY